MSTKQIQGELWSIAPANWARYFEPCFIPMYKKALSYLELEEDTLVLDAGCGSGLFSQMVIDRGAGLIGIDAAAGLLELARKRNPGNNFLEEDLITLPFASDSFDVVTGFNSLQYSGDFPRALAEAKRVLKPGGLLVLGFWDKPEKSEATQILKSIAALLPPPPPGTPGPFALSEDGVVEAAFDREGLQLVAREIVSCPQFYPNIAEALRSYLATGPAAAALKQHQPARVEKTILRAFEPYGLGDGFFHLQNSFLLFVGRK